MEPGGTPESLAWEGPPEQARRGCSLGNARCFLRADAEANLDGLWLAASNRWYSGELAISLPARSDLRPLRSVFAPAFQRGIAAGEGEERIEKTLFLAAPQHGTHLYLRLCGEGFPPGSLVEIRCDWRIAAALSIGHRAQPPFADTERGWEPEQDTLRELIARPRDDGPERLILRFSHERRALLWSEPSRARLTFAVPVEANGAFYFHVCLTAEPDSEPPASAPPEASAAFRQAVDSIRLFITMQPGESGGSPSRRPVASDAVERAVAWGKVASLRVFHRYATGDWGFTNDPPGNAIVTRDVAWFLFGADHFASRFSRELLRTLTSHAVYPTGKIAEYVRLSGDGVTRDDYDLNLNDATPLYILAVAHHWQWTQNEDALAEFVLAAFGAAEWILRQKRADGLVWCDGRGTNAHGIGGWRNIIPGYRLAGALTELNAECVAALRAAAMLAEARGDVERQARFAEEAERLDAAMAQLVDPETGLFFLTRDESGPNRQIAVDLAFPALFRAGPEEARIRALRRLLEPDFAHPFGLRCLSRDDPAYHPRFGWGLMGGSWPNATAWAAAALAPYEREAAWELTERIARALMPEAWRGAGVSVPGQFPEWFDGETGESAGMSLSPWMPATFVWLVEEALSN